MNAFLDTSALLKKYKEEDGTEKLLTILEDVEIVSVSAVTYVEVICSINRGLRELKTEKKIRKKIFENIHIDFGYFQEIPLDNELKNVAFRLSEKYPLKSLDLIQLSSAVLAGQAVFITSDEQLRKIARQEVKEIEFI
jgi:predicted nucleic acid-binding protein